MEETMYIIEGKCWKCNNPMKVALIRGDLDKRGGTTAGPRRFSKEEIELAILKGVTIKDQYSNTRDENYLANSCPSCNAFVGEFYLFKDYFNPAQLGEYKYEVIDL